MVFPSWANGMLMTAAKEFLSGPPYDAAVEKFTAGLQVLPDITALQSASDVTSLTARIGTSSPYTMYSMDFGGMRVETTNLQQPPYNIPENAHLTEVNASPHGAVHPRTYLLMFVRQDVLDRFNRPVPTDWDGLLQLLTDYTAARAMAVAAGPAAAALLPEHGLCITTQPLCGRAGDLLAAIAASVVQTQGAAQGYVYDLLQPPPAAEPLTDGPGWRYAAAMLSRLLQFNAPGANASDPHATLETGDSVIAAAAKCPAISPQFAAGSCLLTFDWDVALRVMARSEVFRRPGAVRLAPLPGSRVVLEPGQNGTLQGCNASTCALSSTHDERYLGGGVNAASGSDASGSASYINRAPMAALLDLRAEVNNLAAGASVMDLWTLLFGFGDLIVYGPRDIRQNVTNAARAALGYTRSADGSWDAKAYASTPWWKAKSSDFAIGPYLALGFDAGLVNSYTQALWHAIHHPNMALDVPSPLLLNWYHWGLGWAAARLAAPPPPVGLNSNTSPSNPSPTAGSSRRLQQQGTPGSSPAAPQSGPGAEAPGDPHEAHASATLATLTTFFEQVVQAHGPALVRQTYASYIGGQYAPPAKTREENTDSGGHRDWLAAAIAVPIVFVLVVAAVALLLVALHMRRSNRDLWGRVRAPRAGPDTSLLVSDVQNSTLLWEALDTAVMEAVVQKHHAVLRRLLSKHNGYETATEGDSFLLAFWSPVNACAYAADVQLALLNVDWPAELLKQNDGCEVIVRVTNQQQQSLCKINVPGAETTGGGGGAHTGFAAAVRSVLSLSYQASRSLAASRSSSSQVGSPVTMPGSSALTVPRMWSHAGNGSAANGYGLGSSRFSHRHIGSTAGAASPSHDDALGSSYPAAAPSPRASLSHVSLQIHAPNADCGGKSPVGGGSSSLLAGFMAEAAAAAAGLGAISSKRMQAASVVPEDAAACAPHHKADSVNWRQRLGLGAHDSRFYSAAYSREFVTDDGEEDACVTWREALAAAFPVFTTPEPAAVRADAKGGRQLRVCHRGLRVRMGIHSGLDSDESIIFNKVSMTYKYYGVFAETAHAVNEAVPGGLVALSGAAFNRLKNARGSLKAAADADLLDGIRISYAGHHLLSGGPRPVVSSPASGGGSVPYSARSTANGGNGGADADAEAEAEAAAADGVPLYVLVPRDLSCRLAYCPPLRTAAEVQLGNQWAPTGLICVGFMKVVGASTLQSELPAAAARALATFQRFVCRRLGAAGGFLVEGGDGLVLTAFRSPSAAITWALDCVEGLKALPWSDELLQHELCEEVCSFDTALGAGGGGPSSQGPGAGTPAPPDAAASPRSTLSARGRSREHAFAIDEAMPANMTLAPIAAAAASNVRPNSGVGAGGGAVASAVAAGVAPSVASVTARAAGSRTGGMQLVRAEALRAARQVLYRGLRVKVGMDIGHVGHALGATSARIEYRGKVMNRSARIAGFASAGQVCVSSALWQAADASGAFYESDRPIVGLSMGLIPLKGVAAGLEILSCVRQTPPS